MIIREVAGTAWSCEGAARGGPGLLPGRRGGGVRRKPGQRPGTRPFRFAVAVSGEYHGRAG